MKVQTGKGTISLMTLIAIWSISLVVNLPGLAVSPMLGNLDKIFPHTSQLEIQLLTVLPNLLIIPFVLLSGKLSESKSKTAIVVTSLLIYLASGILYLFASSMLELILISCLLGMGCGMLIPLAAGLIADTFTGKKRMQQLGIKSGIANISLVLATFIVGWLDGDNWHLPFLVYLLPIVPLLFSVFLKGVEKNTTVSVTSQVHQASVSPPSSLSENKSAGKFMVGRLAAVMGLYFFVSYSVIIISFYLPFLMQDYGMNSSLLGSVTSIFFLAIFLPGFFLPFIIKRLKQGTSLVCTGLIAAGLLLIIVTHSVWGIGIAVFCMGLGYGIFQPIIYDKATGTVLSDKETTLALSFVLAINYLSITLTPFIVDLFRELFHASGNQFPFLLNLVLVALFGVIVWLFRHSFAFKMNEQYYK